MSSYRGKVQELIRERAKALSLSLPRMVGRYLLTLPGEPNNGPNRKKKRNIIDRIWRGSTADPRLSTFIRVIQALGGQVVIRWLEGERLDQQEIILSAEEMNGEGIADTSTPLNE